jgi:hypothetical protein
MRGSRIVCLPGIGLCRALLRPAFFLTPWQLKPVVRAAGLAARMKACA